MSIKKTNKSRRKFLKTSAAVAAASSIPIFNINHAWAQDVVLMESLLMQEELN